MQQSADEIINSLHLFNANHGENKSMKLLLLGREKEANM
jgi:hypothetical protein